MSDENGFKAFPDIVRLMSPIQITEKIHGTNAQILIVPQTAMGEAINGPEMCVVKAFSRTREITPDDDNYGFARWVSENQAELIGLLGTGRHYGEWYGAGINSGYGLKEKRFALFNTRSFPQERPRPHRVDVVPVLYEGPYKPEIVSTTMERLKTFGSQLAPGFMKPEGIVMRFDRNGATFKHVFEAEETGWKGKPGAKKERQEAAESIDINPYLQPIRLEKLLSRDEAYIRNLPASLPEIAKGYVADMEKEAQYENVGEAVVKAAKRGVFPWIKGILKEKGYAL